MAHVLNAIVRKMVSDGAADIASCRGLKSSRAQFQVKKYFRRVGSIDLRMNRLLWVMSACPIWSRIMIIS